MVATFLKMGQHIISVDVEVDLDDIDSTDLVDQVINRIQSTRRSALSLEQCDKLQKALGRTLTIEDKIVVDNLNDFMKVQVLAKLYEKYSIEELEKFLTQ